jgi:hypothetical protein
MLSDRRTAKNFENEIYATQQAEAGIRKAIFCLNAANGDRCGGTYGANYIGETNISLGDGSFTTTLSGTTNTKTVTSVGKAATGQKRTIRAVITNLVQTTTVTGIGNAAAVASDLAIQLRSGSRISRAPTYANSDVICQTLASDTFNYNVHVSSSGGQIYKCGGIYSAYADRVLSSTVTNAYYRNDPADVAGTTVYAIKYSNQATPAARALPSIDLRYFRNIAADGGTISGNYAPANGASFGPVKIDGNLTINYGNAVTINGPIWVKGNFTMNGYSTVNLAAGYGTSGGIILADNASDLANSGQIDVEDTATIEGSGNSQSYLLLVSTNTRTSDSAPAVWARCYSNSLITYAMNGTNRVGTYADIVAAFGRRIYINGGLITNGDWSSGILSGTGGYGLTIGTALGGTWKLVPGSWTEAIK